jgi:hypothetical protein
MRLADDTRGRIPFAVLGVLLLLGSTTYATTMATDGLRVDRDIDVAMDRATAASETALRTAVTRSARAAAETPVAVPATNQWGDVVDAEQPFRDSLAIRIYVAARAGFERAAYRHGDVTAAASLPATPTPDALERALERVTLTAAENGTALQVTIHNVSVVATSGGEVVARETRNRTVTVATPVLALHDRTVQFERALDRGPLEGRGLGRRLTARLYPLAWARGWAQWGGAPVSNVVGTRHVGITTNGAILELQREAYGRADPTGRAGYRRALVRLARDDARAGLGTPATSLATSVAPDPSVFDPNDAPRQLPHLVPEDTVRADRTRDVRVGDTADRAFVGFERGTSGPSLDDVLRRAYQVEVRLRTTTTLLETEPWPAPRPPRGGATLVEESVNPATTVDAGSASLPETVSNWTRFTTATRHVTVRNRITWTWRQGNDTTRTSETVVERYAIGVAVDGSLPALNGTPTRPVVPLFERGGALDGPNLADVPDKSSRFLAERGGVDRIVARVAVDGPDAVDRAGTLDGERPAGLTEWVSRDVLALQRTMRNHSVTTDMATAASGRANPAADLSARIDSQWGSLVDAPAQYDGAADRARVAARAAYLDRVRTALDDRAADSRDANRRLADHLATKGVDLPGRATDILTNRTAVPTDTPSIRGPLGGEDVFVPQGGPAYLDVRGVSETDARWTTARGTAYPLRTENVNLFTVPYGDAAQRVVGSVMGEKTVRLRTAAVMLRAAERASGPDRPRVRHRRDRLDREVSDALETVGERTRLTLGAETSLSRHERHEVVDHAFGRWNRTSARALAATNGSFVSSVVDETGVEGVAAERLRVHLRAAVAEARSSPETRVDHQLVNGTAATVRRVSTTAATEAFGTVAANGTDRLADRLDGRAVVLPAGLPLLPTPTNWYVTVNVWTVTVVGEYPRFAVRTARGRPGETLTYVRDGGFAELDIDGDGDVERLGRADRLDFSVRTVVLVAVPRGGSGVGDVDGQMTEGSPGWE